MATIRANKRAVAVPALAAGMFVLLVVTASRYGYHRDELYFVAAGKHLAWAYPDQGPLTPLIARAMTSISGHSLTMLRLPSALAAAATVLLTGCLARELGAGARGQTLAAACVSVASIVLFTGHTLSTTTFDLLAWTAVSLFVVRASRDARWWVGVGALIGLDCLNKPLAGLLAIAIVLSLLAVGPRWHLSSRWLWTGVALAVALALPYVIWQAEHGWPQLKVSSSISNGGSTSSQPWWSIVPFQALLAGPLLSPVWIVGLVGLYRDAARRFLAVSWLLLAVVFMAAGGKPYYLAGLLPLLIAAGAQPGLDWLAERRWMPAGRVMFAGSAVVALLISLPLLPASDTKVVIAMNPDVGETIGWPDLVHTVAEVYQTQPARTTILTENYGEASAIDRYGPRVGLPQAYSGHNGFGYWGRPREDTSHVVVVGYSLRTAQRYLDDCRTVAHVHNGAHVDNAEANEPVLVCAHIHGTWAAQWARIKHLS